MGIIFKQSLKNTLIIYLSFVIGAINNIYFYPNFLKGEYHGIITLLFSYSNVIMPLTAFGVQYTIVKFFSAYTTKVEKDKFLTWAMVFPLFIALPIAFLWNYFHELIVANLTSESLELQNFTPTIYIFAITCAYFEIFYSWAKVHFQTVFGNILKEFWNRAAILILLVAVFLDLISKPEFIYYTTVSYILRTLLMMGYAFKLYFPKINFQLPDNYKELLKYSGYIILAGSAGAILIDIDKVMIPSKEAISAAAYYSVAVFIGSFIEAPGRAMSQILQPLTSKSLNEDNTIEVENLYKKSSINLLLIGGLFFLLVNCGVSQLFSLMPKGYAGGELVVLMISLTKLYTMSLGNNNAIIQNSKFYKIALPVGIGSALGVYFLNKYFYFDIAIGTEGLALSTMLVVMFFNTFKVWFVQQKFKMKPFTKKSIQLAITISVVFCLFYFWDFSIPEFYLGSLPLHPIINIVLKSFLIIVCYLYVVVKLNVSDQFNGLIKKIIKR